MNIMKLPRSWGCHCCFLNDDIRSPFLIYNGKAFHRSVAECENDILNKFVRAKGIDVSF